MRLLFSTMLLFAANILFAQDLVILHTNDMHSHLQGFSPESEYTPLTNDNDPTLGGFSRIAGFIGSEKEKFGDRLLVVDGGDFLMGTLFQTLEIKEGFELNLLKKMGYEFVAVGNHEFDFGPDALAQIISNSKKNGEIPQILLSNYDKAVSSDDKNLMSHFADKTILPYSVVEKNGYRIGIFALFGIDAAESLTESYGLQFTDQLKTAKKMARFLKEDEKVDLVVVLSHSGVEKNEEGLWEGEDVELGRAVPEIDIIVSAHTHSFLPEPIKAGNAWVVQAGSAGQYVGRIEVKFNAQRKPEVTYRLIPMNDSIPAVAEVQQLIDAKIPEIEKSILSTIGVSFHEVVAETSFELFMDEKNPTPSNLGPLVADAIYERINANDAPGVDVSMVAAGVIRTNIYSGKTGKQNINDVYNVMPLGGGEDLIPGSPLAKIYVSAREFKKVVELILAVYPSKSQYYLYYSGCQIDFNPDKGMFKKVASIKIGNEREGYKQIDTSKKNKELISIAANSYMIGFISKLKKMSFGLVKVLPKNADGSIITNNQFIIDLDNEKEGIQEAKEWLALYYLLSNFPDTNGNGTPDIPELYRTKLNPLNQLQTQNIEPQ